MFVQVLFFSVEDPAMTLTRAQAMDFHYEQLDRSGEVEIRSTSFDIKPFCESSSSCLFRVPTRRIGQFTYR